MDTKTNARIYNSDSAHWYYPDGGPAYELPKASGNATKAPTLADARKLNLICSVTTYLKVLAKPGLESYKIEQACLAVLTSPRKEGEELDAFVKRVLQVEQQQRQDAAQAADRGTAIHAALEAHFNGQPVFEDMKQWIMPAAEAVSKYGTIVATEKVLVGDGYAGKTDLLLESDSCFWLVDWKSARKLPDPRKGGAWFEHRLQLAAYAKALSDKLAGSSTKPVRTMNVYISTEKAGEYVICEHDEWERAYAEGFAPIVTHWCFANGYYPPRAEKPTPATAPASPVPVAKRNVVWTPGVQASQLQPSK